MIKSAAAYLRAFLGGAEHSAADDDATTREGAVPTKEDMRRTMRRTMGTLADQMEEEHLDLLYFLTYGNVDELLAKGRNREKPSGAAAAAAAAAGGVHLVTAPGGGGANAASEAKEKKKQEDDDDIGLFMLF